MDRRLENFRNVLQETEADALLIKSKTNKKYIGALTGSGVKVLLTKENAYQIMDGRYVNEAKSTDSRFEIVVFEQGNSYLEQIKRLCGENVKLAIESSQTLVNEYLQMQKHGFQLILLGNQLEASRKCKDAQEIALVKKACAMTDEIFQEAIEKIHIGMKEYELSALLQYLAISKGASGMAFDTIVASGVRGAMPHGRPTDKIFEEHSCITIDFGITYEGYQSDMTRTVCIGTPVPEMRKIYDVVREAQQKGIDFIRAGVTGKEVDAHVREWITQKGYGEYFTHGLGHGMGMGEGELPLLNQSSNTVLEEHMIMSCEPGIYVPGLGGVRIEDDVLIENGIGIPLNQTTKELICLEVR